jgi:flagellar basal body-associated protein FliL
MESRFKSNNFIAILIALILMATGFALAFLHRQSESKTNQEEKPVAAMTIAVPANDSTST